MKKASIPEARRRDYAKANSNGVKVIKQAPKLSRSNKK